MDFVTLTIFAGALALAAGSPGPSIAALVSRVLQRGWQSVLPFLCAMWIGEAVWLTLAVFGLAAIAEEFQLLFMVIKFAGIGYLLFLAYGMWTAKAGDREDVALVPKSDHPFRMFMAGLAITLGNPKIMVFYLALLPSLLNLLYLNSAIVSPSTALAKVADGAVYGV